ncbi:hypothetical protein [Gordonia soli]|nr:hypothetical protein [Gordonia soli]
MGTGNLMVYLPLVFVLAGVAALGIALRVGRELPIHDRQADAIVGGLLLIIAVVTQGLLNPRYSNVYLLLHLDLLSLWVFILAGSVLMFGLRPTGRYWQAWVILLTMFPFPPRLLILIFGGSTVAAGLVVLVVAVVAAATATARSSRRALTGALLAALVGLTVLAILHVGFPGAPRAVYIWLPSVAAPVIAGLIMYHDSSRTGLVTRRMFDRLDRPLATSTARRPAIVLLLVGAAVHFIQVPTFAVQPAVEIPHLQIGRPLTVPPQWREVSVREYDWARRVYGTDGLMYRQELVALDGNPAWDRANRPRKIVADTISTNRPILFSVYPVNVVYNLVGDRFSDDVPIDLDHGVQGRLSTLVDDSALLTYTRMTWWWGDGARAQGIQLLSVDDHQAGAVFPQPELTTVANVNSVLSVLFRGNAIAQDRDPNFKDRDLIVTAANQIIDAQVEAAGRAAAS